MFSRKYGVAIPDNAAFCQKRGVKLIVEDVAPNTPDEPIPVITPEAVEPEILLPKEETQIKEIPGMSQSPVFCAEPGEKDIPVPKAPSELSKIVKKVGIFAAIGLLVLIISQFQLMNAATPEMRKQNDFL